VTDVRRATTSAPRAPGDDPHDNAARAEGRDGRRGAGSRQRGAARAQASADPREAAREICLQALAIRPRTRAELATAMRKRGVEDEIAAEILDRYDEVGIIDDAAFARAWVTSRHHGRGLSRRALAGELRRKGVSSDEVGQALDQLAPDVEEETARALVARRLRAETRAAPEVVFRRLVGMLARKGYAPGLAVRLVKEALAEREDAAEFADGIDADALADAVIDPDAQ
jgi:regulatory protein